MKKLMLGNEAIAAGAYEAGVRVVVAYPGTPSTEITETAAKYDEIYCEWAPNEKVALEVAIGASFGGGRAMCCMKHVGLNVAADPLYTAAYTGVNGGLVVVVADDPGMHSSQNEQDTRNHAKASHIPVLEPADSKEALEFTKLAYEISEKYDTPVIVRMTTRVSHSQSVVELTGREELALKPFDKNMSKYVMMPAQAKGRRLAVEKREASLAADGADFAINRMELKDKKIGIICSGIAYQYVAQALPEASILKLGMVYPLATDLIKKFAASVEQLYIVEELDPFIETQVKAMGIPCVGKELFPVYGELSVAMIQEKFGIKEAGAPVAQQIPRPPVLCPGCPHRGLFYVLNKLKLNVSGDIGCYTLGALAPLSAMDACVCMGASVSMAHGMQKVNPELGKKTVAVIGDSTFIHSGITGLIDIVYNKGFSTVLILDNSITGMTGHQDNPATGYTIKKEPTVSLNLEALVKAVGVESVQVVDPFDLAEAERIIKAEVAKEEPSVVIVRRPCALIVKQANPPVAFDEEKCKKCNLCFKLGCPAIEKQPDGRAKVNLALCTHCGLCSKVCKFGALG